MSLSGQSIIAGQVVRGSGGITNVVNPATGELLEPAIHFIGVDEIDQAARAAEAQLMKTVAYSFTAVSLMAVPRM